MGVLCGEAVASWTAAAVLATTTVVMTGVTIGTCICLAVAIQHGRKRKNK